MRDDSAMGEEDFAVLEDVVHELFGDAVDPRELSDVISKQGDASEMHVNGPLTLQEKRKRKRQAQIGYASNILGLGAGTAAVVAAARNPNLKLKPENRFPGAEHGARGAGGPITNRIGNYVKSPASRARLYRAGAAGALALQVGNTAGDVAGNIVLGREAKRKLPDDIKYKVKKALDDIVDARKKGVISTQTAIDMSSEIVEKMGVATNFEKEAEKIVPFTTHNKSSLPKTKSLGLKPKLKPQKATLYKAPNSPDDLPVAKSDGPQVTWTAEISKRDDEKRQVFGFAMVTHIDGEPVVDLQGDYTPLEEIEKAAYTYVIESRKGGDMHERDGENPRHTADLVESFVVTPEKLEKMGLDPDAIPHGWWVGFKVNDDKQWEMVKSGERSGFSIHGSGRRVEKMVGA